MSDVTVSCMFCGKVLESPFDDCGNAECSTVGAQMDAAAASLDASFAQTPIAWWCVKDARGMSYKDYEREARDMFFDSSRRR